MGNINRSEEASEQRRPLVFSNFSSALTSGETGVLAYVPFPCVLEGGQIAAFSVTANSNLMFTLRRFIPGVGATSWNIGSTFAPPSFGTSGVLPAGISLPASGSSLLNLMPNDVIGYVVGGGTTSGIFGVAGCFVVRPVQDLKVYLGIV